MNSYCASIFNWALSNSIHIARTLSVRPAKAKHQNRHQNGIGQVGFFLNKFQTDRIRRDQRAVCFAARAVRRPCPPFDDARSASQIARSSRACMVQDRRSGGLPSAARRRALRSGYDSLNASLRSPLHFFRSPTTDRSQTKSLMYRRSANCPVARHSGHSALSRACGAAFGNCSIKFVLLRFHATGFCLCECSKTDN